ncbi:MAG: PAS domain S-box protein [Deferribacteres bacterium]|nr:PAS domain S-box protein [Deferribacteres bacterium]
MRQLAEEKLQKRTGKSFQELSCEESIYLIHELQANQIDLEMQNEELRAVQEELEQSSSRYADLYDFAPVGYFTFDEDGLILDVNLTGAELLGTEAVSLIKKPFFLFIDRDDRDAFYLHRRKVLEEKTRQACEIRLKRKNGMQFHARLESIAVQDSTGYHSQCRTAVSDISDRKLLEEQLKNHREQLMDMVEKFAYELKEADKKIERENAERKQAQKNEAKLLRELKTVFENIPIGIAYLDDELKFIHASRALCDLTGFREEELTGKPCYETIGEYAGDSTRKGGEKVCSFCKKAECFENKRPVRPVVGERALGNKFIRVTMIPESNETGTVSRFMEMREDITEHKRAEAEAKRVSHLAYLGELATGVAHEITNPVNGIINYAQILFNKSGRGSQEQDIARRIIKEGEYISGIARNLLSFALVGKESVSIHIDEILSETLDITKAQLLKDGINLKIKIAPDLPEIVVRPQQIEQVFLNVISNARYALNQKYPETDKDKILEILADSVTIDDRPYIRVVFCDYGKGIPADISGMVMEPFFTTRPDGTGLGLSISHKIVRDHGGKITLESREDEFTKVVIDLPVRP